VLALEALDQHWNESVEQALAPPSGVCNDVQKIPRNATAWGFERPVNETADPDWPGSAAVRVPLESG